MLYCLPCAQTPSGAGGRKAPPKNKGFARARAEPRAGRARPRSGGVEAWQAAGVEVVVEEEVEVEVGVEVCRCGSDIGTHRSP